MNDTSMKDKMPFKVANHQMSENVASISGPIIDGYFYDSDIQNVATSSTFNTPCPWNPECAFYVECILYMRSLLEVVPMDMYLQASFDVYLHASLRVNGTLYWVAACVCS